MKQFKYIIKDSNGIHARPAGLLVREAQKYPCNITIECHGKSANLKQIFNVIGTGAKKGDTVTVTLNGESEESAAVNLEEYFKNNL